MDEIEIEFLVERGVDCVGRADQEERIAVRRRCTTASVAMLVPAPGRFSMTNGWPSRSSAIAPSGARQCRTRHPGRSPQPSVLAARDRPAPTQHTTRQAASQRLPSDVRNVYGAEVSWRPSLKFIAALRTRAQREQIRTFAEGGGRVLDRSMKPIGSGGWSLNSQTSS